ncbi:hypothetical protein GH714_028479 [Hevea brasiliensis]|uniref:ACT domain-containing protein ACR n=1 Tax=Hevea brasiliensis TaxID=3981 RepID=A0A6A6M567_HEVBR|nr:hypothetical protein GH714_028479 [Hevea brasiliensis]
MGILHDDVVIISQSEKERDLSVITVNCPDKTGLGSDLCRILFFGLNIVKGDLSTDGKWCYIVFWVAGNSSTRWGLLKKRLLGVCPSCSSASGISELLHTNRRKEDTYDHLKAVMGDAMISCDIEMVGPEITACSQESSFLPTTITDDMLHLEIPDELPSSLTSASVSVTMDNLLSPAHTLVQIACQDHKESRNCEIDLFVQADGKKVVDPNKQKALSSRLEMELLRPLRVAVVSRGPDTELLVANPVELSGKGRPLVFHDITLALKMLKTCIFSAEIRRRMIGDREFEVYRVLLDEGESLRIPRSKIEEAVWNMLMGWD